MRQSSDGNRMLVIKTIEQNPRISRQEIADITGLNPAFVSKTCAHLLDQNRIREVGFGRSSGGRRPVYLVKNRHAAYTLCVTVSNCGITLQLCDCGANPMRYQQFPTENPTSTHTIDQVISSFFSTFAEPPHTYVGLSLEDTLWVAHNRPLTAHLQFRFGRHFVLSTKKSSATLTGRNGLVYHNQYAYYGYLHIGQEIYASAIDNQHSVTGAHLQAATNLSQLPQAQALLQTLAQHIYCQTPEKTMELVKLFNIFYDTELILIDLSDLNIPPDIQPLFLTTALQESSIHIDFLFHPSLEGRGLSNLISAYLEHTIWKGDDL